jgi:transposase
MGWYDRKLRRVRDLSCGDTRIFLELEVRRLDCRHCGKVKRERLDFLADNPLYTKRFAYYVGRRCRSATIKDVAAELKLDWHTVKALDQQYMEAQLERAGMPSPQVIGIDEIAIRKGHTYRIVVSDLLRGRPIWFGGTDRSEASMGEFYTRLGKKKSSRIRLAVMDMWKPFRLATAAHAPQAAILFDKFHVMRHLGEALDQVRKSEYGRLAGRDRRRRGAQQQDSGDPAPRLRLAQRGLSAAQDPHLHAAGPVAVPGLCTSVPCSPWRRARLCHQCKDRACDIADLAVDMMDNASALPTCPQRPQQQKTVAQNWPKITHTTSR